MARPPTYASAEEKPVTVSVRIPREVYEEVQRHVSQRRMTLTAALLDGLTLWLETPADPRDMRVLQKNTVMQEWEAMVDARIEAALVRERTLAPSSALTTPIPALSNDDNNTVIQEEAGLRLTREASAALAPEVSYDDNNTVIQESSRAAAVPTGAKPQPGRPVPFKEQVLAVVTAHGPLTCDAVADAVHDAKHKKTWRVLQELIAQGRLSKEGSRERTMYQVA